MGCQLNCVTVCKAKEHGCASECPALPWQPPQLAEIMARRFHEAYERLAPQFGYETRTETRQFDPASKNGQLMVAVCREMLGQ